MAVHRLDEVLAQADPFELAQAVERHVQTLDAQQIRELVAPVLGRAGKYYRDELTFLLDPGLSEPALRKAFVRFLQSNLRAIVFFGPAFSDAILKDVPSHRVVAIGEERRGLDPRAALVAGTAIALIILGAAAEHAVTNARAAAQTPAPSAPVTAPLAISSTPRPLVVTGQHPARPHRRVAALDPTAAPATPPPATPAPSTAAPAAAAQPVAVPPAVAPAPAPVSQRQPQHRPPPGRATLTIAVTPPPPTPEPTPLDVTDMPQSFTDATPLPSASTTSVDNPNAGRIATPKPTARPRRGMLNHLIPLGPGAHIRIP